MKPALLKSNEMVVNKDDFGFLVQEFIATCLRPTCNISAEWIDQRLREWWPMIEPWYLRRIQCDIEVAIALDEPPRYNRQPLNNKQMWVKIIEDLRPAKSPYTVKYQCDKCNQEGVKLWRGVHGCADENGHELLCATCLAPDVKVGPDGKAQSLPNNGSTFIHTTDQINGWLPAVPTDNTFWGYSSIPSQDVEWWQALPTYPKAK